MQHRIRVVALAVMALAFGTSTASAQVFGTFAWQMQPYCNQVTLTITQIPGGYTIDGNDNQCGAGKLAGAAGMALINPDGTVGLEFTIVTAPAGKALHVSASLDPATGSGPWTDSVGNSGTLALGANAAGIARPFPASGLGASVITTAEIANGAVGAADINTAEVQARVTGVCAAGQSMQGVNTNGTVACGYGEAIASAVVIGSSFLYNRGFATVTRPATGVYCLTPTLPAGVTLASVYPHVSVDWAASSGDSLFAYALFDNTFGCSAGTVPVRTYSLTGAPVTGVAASNNVAFIITLFRR